MSKSLYMHTIDGRPAYYYQGEQIVFASKFHHIKFEDIFVDSLDKIRRQQKASQQWRIKRGFNAKIRDDTNYDYIRVLKPEGYEQ